MSEEQMKQLVKEAIKQFKIENQKEQKKQAYHNTRLLLRHYNDLKTHVENAIGDIKDIEVDIMDMDADEVYIHSIKRSKAKTAIMLAHIEAAMHQLEQKQKKLGTHERYKALQMYFLENKSYEDIKDILFCGINTPSRWIDQMVKELSIYLFGIEGLKLSV